MPWFNVDDGFYDHPKVDDLPLAAVGLWTLAGAYCMRQLTDGAITASRVRKFGAEPDAIDALVDAHLWERTPDGYQFKGWADWQMTRAQVEEKRAKERERKQKQRRGPDGTYTGSPKGSHADVPVGHPRDTQRDSAPRHTVQSNPIQSHSPTESERRAKRATPLPDDWAPTEAHRILATERGIDCDLEAEKMRDWAAAKGETGKDWDARFRNWLRNARPSGNARTKTSARLDGAMTLIQQLEAQEGHDPWNAPRQLGS